jgi:hypothetical protein
MAQEQHLFPFVGRTICTNISYAFVVVTSARQSHTRDIKQNTTESTFPWHAFLVGPAMCMR